jgi:hypothetical protein
MGERNRDISVSPSRMSAYLVERALQALFDRSRELNSPVTLKPECLQPKSSTRSIRWFVPEELSLQKSLHGGRCANTLILRILRAYLAMEKRDRAKFLNGQGW